MAWLAKLDARATRWPWSSRALYLILKWCLVAAGAYLLLGLYVERWGVLATVWFFAVPFLYGLWRSWPTRPPSTPRSP